MERQVISLLHGGRDVWVVIKDAWVTGTPQSVTADMTHIRAYVCQAIQAVPVMSAAVRVGDPALVCHCSLWERDALILLKLYYASPVRVL